MASAVIYSGGKDSFLALTHALKRNEDVRLLINLDIKPNLHHKFFNEHSKKQILKQHSRLLKIPILFLKVRSNEYNPDTFLKDSNEIYKVFFKFRDLLKNKYGISKIYSGSTIFDEKPSVLEIEKAIIDLGFRFIAPIRDYCLKNIINECLKENIKALINSITRFKNIQTKWLGKVIDKSFLNYLEKHHNVDGNDIQTTVIYSPLFGKKHITVDNFRIRYDENNIYFIFKSKILNL